MTQDTALNFYLALLSVQMAILGFVVAGIVTLMQMLHNAKPHRVTSLLIRHSVLYAYVGLMVAVLIGLCIGAWAIAFDQVTIEEFFLDANVGGLLLALCLVGLFWFVQLIYKARTLLQADEYLRTYIQAQDMNDVRGYLYKLYAREPEEPAEGAPEHEKAAYQTALQTWEEQYQQVQYRQDPFQPIREYVKDNALKLYDFGTKSGMKFFSEFFDQTFQAISKNPQPGEYAHLAKYLHDSALEYFNVFRKTSSERRKEDLIKTVRIKGREFAAIPSGEGFITVVRTIEGMAKMADDDEVILAIDSIQDLLDDYLSQHKGKPWQEIAQIFEETCLSVTRIAEQYFIQGNNTLQTVPIIGHYTGEYQTVTGLLVKFFTTYDNLADDYADAYPVLYFEAIEAVIEVLFARYAEIVEAGRQTVGLNAQYQVLLKTLYGIYFTFGIDAIEHKKPELVALCLANLRRVIKPAKNLKLDDSYADILDAFVEIALKSVSQLGDTIVKDTRTITDYSVQTLEKHATKPAVKAVVDAYKDDAGVDFTNDATKKLIKAITT